MRIITKDFNALKTSALLSKKDSSLEIGKKVYESRSGLSGSLQFLTKPGLVLVDGFREDALPTPLPETFFIFSGHGSIPQNIEIFKDFGSKALDSNSDGVVESAPWWSNFEEATFPLCKYTEQIKWACWRSLSSENKDGPKRHGVSIDIESVFASCPGVFDFKSPFFRISEDWCAMPPKTDEYSGGMLFNKKGDVVHIISDWDFNISRLFEIGPVNYLIDQMRLYGLDRAPNMCPENIGIIGCQDVVLIDSERNLFYTKRTGLVERHLSKEYKCYLPQINIILETIGKRMISTENQVMFVENIDEDKNEKGLTNDEPFEIIKRHNFD